MRIMCIRVSLLSLKCFIYSTVIITALLIFWFAIGWDLYKFDAVLVKDPIKSGGSKDNWQEHNPTDGINSLSPIHVNKAIWPVSHNDHSLGRRNKSAIAYFKRYSTRDEHGRFRHGDVEHQNANSDSSEKHLMDYTETAFNWDTTTNAAILGNKRTFPFSNARKIKPKRIDTGNLKPSLSVRSPISSKHSLDVSTNVAKNSVYGEVGCPDNPWREDLQDLLRTWVRISKRNNIEYVLAYGSLLGAMRDGDVIPNDSDIDILVDVNYFSIIKSLSVERNFHSSNEKIRLVVQPEFALNISVESRKRLDCRGKETPFIIDECSFQEPMARLINGKLHIDFYHFYNRVDTIEDPGEDRLKKYHKNDFYPLRSCTFMSLQAFCPKNPWKVLRIYFNTDDLEPIYKCTNGTWVDKDGFAADAVKIEHASKEKMTGSVPSVLSQNIIQHILSSQIC